MSSTSFPDLCLEDSSRLPGSGQREATTDTGECCDDVYLFTVLLTPCVTVCVRVGQPPLEQQLYVNQALMLYVGLLCDAEYRYRYSTPPTLRHSIMSHDQRPVHLLI
jgi:hypothetical protein